MNNPTPPADALQKARELAELRKKAAEESNAIGRHGKAAMEWKRESYVHFPSIHAELEKVTAERDVALKGYRAMRESISLCSGSCHSILTSFPEIK